MRALLALTIASCVPATTHPGSPSAASILVTTQATCPAGVAGCDVLEILDLHTDASSEEKGFAELKQLARVRGGDAVIGAEFEHGGEGERSHLSGMVVRYGAPIPPHTVLGEVEISSAPDDQQKGLEQLMARASAMGGDQVIAVTFEHGEEGAQGRLRGRVIRFRR